MFRGDAFCKSKSSSPIETAAGFHFVAIRQRKRSNRRIFLVVVLGGFCESLKPDLFVKIEGGIIAIDDFKKNNLRFTLAKFLKCGFHQFPGNTTAAICR